jgi:hypothetical protein
MPLDTLANLILEGQAQDHTAKEAYTALGLPRGYSAKKHSAPAMLLCQYHSHWQQHDGLLYYQMQLYVLAAGGAGTEVLCRHHDNPIVGHFGAKHTLELVARKYYRRGMARKVKAYTCTCSNCAMCGIGRMEAWSHILSRVAHRQTFWWTSLLAFQ